MFFAKRLRQILLASMASALIFAGPCLAQTNLVQPGWANYAVLSKNVQSRLAKGAEIRIAVNFSLSTPVESSAPDKIAEAQIQSRKRIYQEIGQECDLLTQTLAQRCELQSANVNSSVQNRGGFGSIGPAQAAVILTGANASFRVMLRAAPEKGGGEPIQKKLRARSGAPAQKPNSP
ncbi:MAG TPA: hypothetical protein VMU56_10110 [Beijerinckiaceae bacterium]|nr:hypothetical protein [Beijerinckiaceae bacterium]